MGLGPVGGGQPSGVSHPRGRAWGAPPRPLQLRAMVRPRCRKGGSSFEACKHQKGGERPGGCCFRLFLLKVKGMC